MSRSDATEAEHAVAGSGSGSSLHPAVEDRMEGAFGVDFSSVRVHTDAAAQRAAHKLNARAFTSGSDIYLARGESPTAPDLLGHELTHVVQQNGTEHGSPATLVQREGGPLDQRLDDEFQDWSIAVDEFDAAENHSYAAYALRIVIMLQGQDGDQFEDEDALEAFLDELYEAALDEDATIARTGDWAWQLAPKAFPLYWSDLVYDALYLDVDTDRLLEEAYGRWTELEDTAERVPGEVAESGLPVSYEQASSLSEFHLRLRHVNLDRPHVVKDMAVASRDYAMAGWAQGFYLLWNAMAEGFAESVAAGELVVEYPDYQEFIDTKQEGLRALADRIGTVTTEDLLESFDNEVTEITRVAFIQAVASALLGLVPAMLYWGEGRQLFDERLAEADAIIAGEDGEAKVMRALQWAYEANYFGAAGQEMLDAILSHGWQILGMAAGFLIVQYIPYLNIAVDVAVVLYAGVDALQALYSLYESFASVSEAQSVVQLQRASARLAASLEGDGLRVLLDVLAITVAARGIRTRADALQRSGLSEEEALRRALQEATGEEATALRNAVARRRIQTRFDPDGVLEPMMDMGVNPEIVERALTSGMTPQRLVAIAEGATDAARIQAVIEYAGSHAGSVNALLDAGFPMARLSELADLGLGARELRSCQIVLERTGQIAEVEGLVNFMGQTGATGVRQLARLTAEEIADLYQAGGGVFRSWSQQELAQAHALADQLPYGPVHAERLQTRALTEAAQANRQVPITTRQQQLIDQMGSTTPVRDRFGVPRYDSERIELSRPITAEDLRNMTAHTGLEHGVVRGQDGRLYLTRGGPNDPGTLPGDEVLVHSHPFETPPSGLRTGGGDIGVAERAGHAVVGPDGRISIYGQQGLIPAEGAPSYVSGHGVIDGTLHQLGSTPPRAPVR
jgi:hypothetical protein